MKLFAFVGGETEIPMAESPSNKKELILRTATVYWKFKNIIRDVNNSVDNADLQGNPV